MIDPIYCAAACKRNVPDEKAASDAGWSFLPIMQRWRCPDCGRELAAVNNPPEEKSE